MKKSILNLGRALNKADQIRVKGGDDEIISAGPSSKCHYSSLKKCTEGSNAGCNPGEVCVADSKRIEISVKDGNFKDFGFGHIHKFICVCQ
ncbi:hypothetical protein [uncultured Tenacibaculum sp.]|uniref:hypothetical protein n=1 Tax=uncultured Tenacibaculum sp. TaxID=174713 RepID=UPI0026058384|nr:hypothetical protein [uncultured Tenacibaculum sp.]